MVAFLNKIILRKKKKKLHTSEQGILSCPPNYTKNGKVRNFLDTPDPKAEMPTSQTVHGLRASRGCREIRMVPRPRSGPPSLSGV